MATYYPEEEVRQFGVEPDEPDEKDDKEVKSEPEEDIEIVDAPDESSDAETQSDESQEEEPEEDDSYKKKRSHRVSAKTRINQISREKYQALHELEKARAEAEQYKKMYKLTSEAAIKQYDDNINNRLEAAKRSKVEAIELGDSQAQADADIEISRIVNEMQQANQWKAQQQFESQYQYQEPSEDAQYQQAIAERQYYAEQWNEANPWIYEDSPRYDQNLAAETKVFAKLLDYDLAAAGYAHQIGTPEYFAEVDNFVNMKRQERNQRNQHGRNLNMKVPRGGASPSRQTPGGYSQPNRFVITSSEKEICKNLGISEKDYILNREKWKKEKGVHRNEGGY